MARPVSEAEFRYLSARLDDEQDKFWIPESTVSEQKAAAATPESKVNVKLEHDGAQILELITAVRNKALVKVDSKDEKQTKTQKLVKAMKDKATADLAANLAHVLDLSKFQDKEVAQFLAKVAQVTKPPTEAITTQTFCAAVKAGGEPTAHFLSLL